MIPRFRLERPATVKAALEAQARDADDSAYLAGGTELLQVMKMGLLDVGCLIDLKGLPGLRDIGIAADGSVRIGALATHHQIERDPVVAARLPELGALERRVANSRVRATGTIGGNLAFAEPHSDPATFLVACGASVELVGARGRRILPLETFLVGALTTSRTRDEIVCAITIPPAAPGTGRAYEKYAFFERPTASAAVSARQRAGRIVEATVVVGSVTERPTTLRATGAALAGASLSGLREVMGALQRDPPDEIDAFSDHTGSADYKRHLTWQLVAAAAYRAAEMAVA